MLKCQMFERLPHQRKSLLNTVGFNLPYQINVNDENPLRQ